MSKWYNVDGIFINKEYITAVVPGSKSYPGYINTLDGREWRITTDVYDKLVKELLKDEEEH